MTTEEKLLQALNSLLDKQNILLHEIKARLDLLVARPAQLPNTIGTTYGCVCPLGAEMQCGNTGCPRRAHQLWAYSATSIGGQNHYAHGLQGQSRVMGWATPEDKASFEEAYSVMSGLTRMNSTGEAITPAPRPYEWPGQGPEPPKWTAFDGTIVYKGEE